ncbi:MAG: hypothetical protein RIA08_18525 [Roseovarius sp.]|uniref:hypothetical protein n=1 Tax=Roseovarius sp. TaxID=1486281 RepID=UPI0032ED148E
MKKGTLPEAPNYTNAALIMALVNLLWIFMVLWAVFGLPVVLAISYGLNLLITRIGHRA